MSLVPVPEVEITTLIVSPAALVDVAVSTASLKSSLSPIKSLLLVKVTEGTPSLSSILNSTLVPDDAA